MKESLVPVELQSFPGSLSQCPKSENSILITSSGQIRRGLLKKLPFSPRKVVATVDAPPSLRFTQGLVQEILNDHDVSNVQLLAIGGGSTLDAAKAVKVSLEAEGGAEADFLPKVLRDGASVNIQRKVPFVAVPTTAGTGSEVTPWATIWDTERHKKLSLSGSNLYPDLCLLDGELLTSLPRQETVVSALDAFSHAFEGLWNHHATSKTDEMAYQVLAKLPGTLIAAIESPEAIDTRQHTLELSNLAGQIISQTRSALAHSISYPLTLKFGIPHGLACSFTLPEILRLQATHLGKKAQAIYSSFSSKNLESTIDHLYDFYLKIDISHLLRPFKLETEQLELLRGQFATSDRAKNSLIGVSEQSALKLIQTARDKIFALS